MKPTDLHVNLMKPSGFREYDARWLYGTEIDLPGVYSVGLAFGTMLHERGGLPRVVTGYDYRSYSETIQQALNSGLEAAGCEVHDIGFALTPMAYFAQFALDVPAVAMVTASHNENGWTGNWKTGHSYMKRRTAEIGAIAGFEKSGHYFFREPYGRGYDDGLLSGIMICEMLASSGKSLADLYRDLPRSWTSPTISPHCADETKYTVVQTVSDHIRDLHAMGWRSPVRGLLDFPR